MLILLVACAGSDGKGGGDDTGTVPLELPEDCSALPAADGGHYGPGDAGILRDVVAAAAPGTTIVLDSGTYDMSGGDGASNLEIPAGVTVRSDGGSVVLEGGYATTELVTLAGDGAAVADLTLSHAYGQGIAVRGASNTRIYRVVVEDAGDVGIGVYPDRGVYADDAVIGCSTVTRTDSCGVGIDTVQADGTWVYGTTVDAPNCEDPGMRFATGSRNTVLERSQIRAGGLVGLAWGDDEYGEGDERPSDECPDRVLVGHYGGVVRNVFVSGGGLRVEDVCGGTIVHNSVWGGELAYAFSDGAEFSGNLGSASGVTGDNLTPTAADFVDADGGDLHLADGSAAIDGATASADTPGDDIDGEPRNDGHPDYGADER